MMKKMLMISVAALLVFLATAPANAQASTQVNTQASTQVNTQANTQEGALKLPAYKKAGVKDFWVYAANIGAPGGRITTVRPIANYAELDQPGLLNRAGMAQEAIQQLNARRAALTAGNETSVSRFVPELSYGMPAPPPARTGN